MNNEKIYLVNGYSYENGYEYEWIEKIFVDEKQADACCKYLNNTCGRTKRYHVSMHKICTYDYAGMLECKKEHVIKSIRKQEMMRCGCGY